jgi:hypothetical protein
MSERNERLKVIAGIVAVTFSITLAVIIGMRLSDESLAVLAGAVCGVGAAIPSSLLVITVARRNDRNASAPPHQGREPYPPVVIITPSGTQPHLPAHQLDLWSQPPQQRTFTVVGDECDQ